jgi:hypothetical protein
MQIDPNHIMQLAQAELAQERLRAAVNARKEHLRRAKWWHRLFPYSISITIKRRT